MKTKEEKEGKATTYKSEWYRANRERLLVKQAAYRAARREELRSAQRAYYAANREKLLAQQRGYYARDPRRHAEQQTIYRNANRAKINEAKRIARLADLPKALWLGARRRVRARGYEFNITPEDIQVTARCPICCQAMLSPSLDRIENTKGYVRGNVAVICLRCNRLKNHGTAAEHRRIADWMDSQAASLTSTSACIAEVNVEMGGKP